MRLRIPCFLVALLLLATMTAEAQMSGSSTGRYATHTLSDDVQQMPDGSTVILTHYYQITFADGDHPIDNVSSSCVGKLKFAADGSPQWANGSCFNTNAEGDGSSFWWRMTEAGTANCSDICGEWGYFAGHGKFEGLAGTGTWQRTTLFSDGSTGTWQGSYTLPQ